LCTQQRCCVAVGNSAERRPRAQRPVAGHQLGLAQPAVAQIAQHRRPRVLTLAITVLDREQLLAAVLTDAYHHQQTDLGVLAQPHGDVHTIDEQVRVTVKAQLPLSKRGALGLPDLGQPRNQAR
jgi:hypothetical protein